MPFERVNYNQALLNFVNISVFVSYAPGPQASHLMLKRLGFPIPSKGVLKIDVVKAVIFSCTFLLPDFFHFSISAIALCDNSISTSLQLLPEPLSRP